MFFTSVSEDFVQFVWKYTLYESIGLYTSCGQQVQVISPGEQNTIGGNDFFQAKIKDYKLLASTYVLFESVNNKGFGNPESIITSKITILEHITSTPDSKISLSPIVEELMSLDKGTGSLAYKIMLEKYNTKFDGLSKEQKELLKEYINSASDAPKLKEFLNTKFKGISAVLKENVGKIEDPALKIKIQEVINLIAPILETRKLKDDHLVALLQYLDLSNEIVTV